MLSDEYQFTLILLFWSTFYTWQSDTSQFSGRQKV